MNGQRKEKVILKPITHKILKLKNGLLHLNLGMNMKGQGQITIIIWTTTGMKVMKTGLCCMVINMNTIQKVIIIPKLPIIGIPTAMIGK